MHSKTTILSAVTIMFLSACSLEREVTPVGPDEVRHWKNNGLFEAGGEYYLSVNISFFENKIVLSDDAGELFRLNTSVFSDTSCLSHIHGSSAFVHSKFGNDQNIVRILYFSDGQNEYTC